MHVIKTNARISQIEEQQILWGESRNENCMCKTWVMHAMLRKGNKMLKTKLLQDKNNSKCQWSINKKGKKTLAQAKETKATKKATKDKKSKTYLVVSTVPKVPRCLGNVKAPRLNVKMISSNVH